MTESHLVRRACAEAIGTFFLVFIGVGSIMVDTATGALGHTGVSACFGLVVAAVIYAIGHLSGAHINPAVTIGFASVRRFPLGDVLPYIAAQCVGAVLAALVLRGIVTVPPGTGATIPAMPGAAAFAVEFTLTFLLMFVIIAVATDRRATAGFAGLAIGATVGMAALMGGPLTGASMNPARSLGPALAGAAWESHGLYWAAPIIGAISAALAYEGLRAATLPHDRITGTRGPVTND